MIRWVRQYFRFSRREMQGMMVLLLLILVILILPAVLRPWLYPQKPIDPARIQEIEQHFAALSEAKAQTQAQPVRTRTQRLTAQQDIVLEPFDPNHASLSDWRSMGLTERQAQVILNYINSGGHFRAKEDLLKIYSIRPTDYERIAPYIVFTPPKPIELNQADSLDLQRLPGIGPAFASRILRFRALLGGFHSTDQLLEVYGMDSTRWNGFLNLVDIDTTHIQRLPINQSDITTLGRHPLIGYTKARHIHRYREQHGDFTTLKDLADIHVLDAQFLRNIAPYIDFTIEEKPDL